MGNITTMLLQIYYEKGIFSRIYLKNKRVTFLRTNNPRKDPQKCCSGHDLTSPGNFKITLNLKRRWIRMNVQATTAIWRPGPVWT